MYLVLKSIYNLLLECISHKPKKLDYISLDLLSHWITFRAKARARAKCRAKDHIPTITDELFQFLH